MGIGSALDRIFAERPGDAEFVGHPVRVWRSWSVAMKVAWVVSVVWAPAVLVAYIAFLLGFLCGIL